MISRNLRHFRVFLAAVDLGSATRAAEACRISQPAATQALQRLGRDSGGALFERSRDGIEPTPRGAVLAARIRRGMDRLDAALAEIAPRLVLTATSAQLSALSAAAEAQNFTLAARALGLAQPTLHRAVARLEREAGRPLFERTASGLVPTRACRDLAQATNLAFAEFDQAEADLAEFDGRESGRIVIGSLPLGRSVVLPEALARFRALRPNQLVTVIDGPYDEMLGQLRRGRIDVIFGAMRDPLPIADIVQEPLFSDHLTVVARPGHPLAGAGTVPLDRLGHHAWAVPRPGTPSRAQFDEAFDRRGMSLPQGVVECGSILLMRELLVRSDMLGCISGQQAGAELQRGLLVRIDVGVDWPARAIGLTHRAGWVPTAAQALLLDEIRAAAPAQPPLAFDR
ncbi:LysR family transcriptional regulator [Rhodobacterales bacterium HKCCE3408]|nr:LysR family transcriptional regulator [Rhodobacterales bacterium HKCCE3408]